jgi:hypothetical protein
MHPACCISDLNMPRRRFSRCYDARPVHRLLPWTRFSSHLLPLSAGQEYEARLCKTLLPRISKSDVEGCAALFHPSNNCVIKVVEHRRRCSEAQLEALVARVVEQEKKVGHCSCPGTSIMLAGKQLQ